MPGMIQLRSSLYLPRNHIEMCAFASARCVWNPCPRYYTCMPCGDPIPPIPRSIYTAAAAAAAAAAESFLGFDAMAHSTEFNIVSP